MDKHLFFDDRRRWRSGLWGAVALCIASLAAPDVAQAQVRDVSVQDLARASTAVIVGTTVDSRAAWNADRSKIFTDVTVRVDERIAGEAQAETIIRVPGGRVGNTLYDVSDMPVFVDGEQVVVFLWQAPDGTQVVTGSAQGKMTIVDDEAGERRVVGGALDRPAPGPNDPRLNVQGERRTSAARPVGLDELRRLVREARADQ